MKPATIRRRPVRVVIGLLAVAAVVGGCGGSKSDTDKVKSTVTDFFAAIGEGKGEAACAQLTDSAVQQLTSAAFLLRPPSSCADAITTFNKALSDDDKKSLKSTKVNRVTVTANSAMVADNDIELKAGGEVGLFRNRSPEPMALEKVASSWKISSLG